MESQAHIDLVKRIYEYVLRIVGEQNHCLIEMDSLGNNSNVRVINNFIPDLYYSFGNQLIIGEAKTERDFDRKHSMQQYDAYIKECSVYQGEAVLVVGVPWQLSATARNYFRRKKNNGEIEFSVVVVDEMGRSCQL